MMAPAEWLVRWSFSADAAASSCNSILPVELGASAAVASHMRSGHWTRPWVAHAHYNQ